MQQLEGINLRPLFYSEISSSYLVSEIFRNHNGIAKSFLKTFFNIDIDKFESIDREKNYRGKGFIDIIMQCESNGRKIHILIEIKVHDYISATPEQITTYFDAAMEELRDGDIYFVYLTQFNTNNSPMEKGASLPGTIKEYKSAKRRLEKYKDKLRHINWSEFHSFLKQFKVLLNQEEILMLELQEKWMKAESDNDIRRNIIDVGDRDLADYFDDVKVDLIKEIPFGKIENKNKRSVLIIDISQCNYGELNIVLDVIKKYCSSKRIEKKSIRATEDITISGAKEFLSNLSQEIVKWKLLGFYSLLFDYIHSTDYLLLNGTGTRGFSIRVSIKEKGIISLCTLWANGTIEFSLKR